MNSSMEILRALEHEDNCDYDESMVSLFKGYANPGNYCFIISWMQSTLCNESFHMEILKQDFNVNSLNHKSHLLS